MNKYTVTWETTIGVGSTFYQGKESVMAEDSDTAREMVQRNVWLRAFRDYGINHIVITDVKEVSR